MNLSPRYTSALLVLAALASGCTAQDAQLKSTTQATPVATPTPYAMTDSLQPIYFEAGKSHLDAASMQTLKSNVDWLKTNLPSRIQIAGFSDGRGTPEQNLAVGQRRAAALRDYYASMGIPRSRISTISHGQEEPVCFDMSDECQAKNRRADTLIENKELAAK